MAQHIVQEATYTNGMEMKISEMIEILQNYHQRFGDCDVYKIFGCSYREIDSVEFVGGSRCLLMNQKYDKRNYEIIQEMQEYANRQRTKEWLADCED